MENNVHVHYIFCKRSVLSLLDTSEKLIVPIPPVLAYFSNLKQEIVSKTFKDVLSVSQS